MEISYSTSGDYLLPNLVLYNPPDTPPLGLYGELHKRHLHYHRPIQYSELLLTERLYPLCRAVDEQAAERMRTISDHKQAHEIALMIANNNNPLSPL